VVSIQQNSCGKNRSAYLPTRFGVNVIQNLLFFSFFSKVLIEFTSHTYELYMHERARPLRAYYEQGLPVQYSCGFSERISRREESDSPAK